MSRAAELQAALQRAETRLRICHRNLREADPANGRLLNKLRSDFYRASDDLSWMRRRFDEALSGGGEAFRRHG